MFILMIDNYDSFTYNLVQYFGVMGHTLRVFRNDRITVCDILNLDPDKIVISPGPGRPYDAGASKEIIEVLGSRKQILGVCLGHQCIGEVFGGKVVKAEKVMHGKTSPIYHDGKTIFRNVKNPFIAARYHSLVVDENSFPACLEVSAKTKEGIIMGIRHRSLSLEGIQFHPESFLTEEGMKILQNFVGL